MDCFNEGFSDEDTRAAADSSLPKVYLNYTKAHLDAIEPPEAALLRSAGQASPESEELQVTLPESADGSPVRRRHRSVDAGTQDQPDHENCKVDIDAEAYLEEVKEEVQGSKEQNVQGDGTTGLFSQFKKVFANSPGPNSSIKLRGLPKENAKKIRYPLREAFIETPMIQKRDTAPGILEFSPRRQAPRLPSQVGGPLAIKESHQIDDSLLLQSEVNTTRSTFVMAPICMNTPAGSTHRKRDELVTCQPPPQLDSALLYQAKENMRQEELDRQTCYVQLGQKSFNKVRELQMRQKARITTEVSAFAGISKRGRI